MFYSWGPDPPRAEALWGHTWANLVESVLIGFYGDHFDNNVIIDIVIANNIISKLLKMAFLGIIIVR